MKDCILLDAGSGGRASQRLIEDIFRKYFSNPVLDEMNDAAFLVTERPRLSFSTDSYTVTPLIFPGGSIGDLAVNGTVNDIAMLGATPLWLSCAFIIEEGLGFSTLERVVQDMARAAKNANIKIVTGDTKVVEAGACDGLFINTSGIGEIYADPVPTGHNARAGDAVLLSGTIGDHGLAIMAAREDGFFLEELASDSAPLAAMIKAVIEGAGPVHVLRDPTRGGLATSLNEIAQQSDVCIEIDETSIPVKSAVSDGCSFLGLDPLYLANEGKCIVILPEQKAEAALKILRSFSQGRDAAQIGRVTAGKRGRVIMNTQIGGQRIINMLEGAQLPRIC